MTFEVFYCAVEDSEVQHDFVTTLEIDDREDMSGFDADAQQAAEEDYDSRCAMDVSLDEMAVVSVSGIYLDTTTSEVKR